MFLNAQERCSFKRARISLCDIHVFLQSQLASWLVSNLTVAGWQNHNHVLRDLFNSQSQ